MKVYAFRKMALVAVVFCALGALGGCKKKVPPAPPVEEVRPVELRVLSVRPNQGSSDQTTSITLSGTGFKSGARVMVGENLATDVTVPSADTVRAVVPSGMQAGAYTVVVRNPDGKEGSLQAGFTVTAAPPRGPSGPSSDCQVATVYFGFDSSDLSDEARSGLKANMDCLKARSAVRVELQGHTDERGSTDYNLALGQRRADEVKRYLSTLGFSNIASVSYGEERPAELRSDEDAWARNRRVETQIQE